MNIKKKYTVLFVIALVFRKPIKANKHINLTATYMYARIDPVKKIIGKEIKITI